MRTKVPLLIVFALAMGYLEAAVVVYLRAIVYPQGFAFPIRTIDLHLAAVELGREGATIAMMLAVAFLAEATRRGRFACFMVLFGVWDLAYYLFLKVTISWPESLLTWDLLFLIPVIWTGPVLAPMMVSALLIATGLLYYTHRGASEAAVIRAYEWAVAIAGGIIVFVAFGLNHAPVYSGEIPARFPWEVFVAGMAMALAVLLKVARRITSLV
jgi:hypothetical protein